MCLCVIVCVCVCVCVYSLSPMCSLCDIEMLNNKESHRLEWIIIILIGAEIAIGLAGLASGWVGGVPGVSAGGH